MEIIWFCLVAIMIAVYVVLDGFDLGAGINHLFIAKTDAERRQVLQSVGPVWDGNEVWLLAGGGVLYFAFPKLYASAFAGFYLPLIVVLWLLMLRGVSIEFRHRLDTPTWGPFWDVVFAGASTLLAVFLGAALGNVVRGVPLNAHGEFFLPLWTHFNIGPYPGVLDWYTVLVGVLAAATLAMHGALWVAYKTEGELQARARRCGRISWFGVVAMTLLVTAITFSIQPVIPAGFAARPWGWIFPLLAVAGLAGVFGFSRSPTGDLKAFLSSCLFIVGMLTSVVQGVFPDVLPASTRPELALTIHNAAAPAYGLKVGLAWWIPGMILVAGYFIYSYHRLRGKVQV